MPFLPKAIDPKEIVAKARDRILPSYEEASPCSFRDDTTASVSSDKATCKLNSQLALAREAVHDKRVGLTEMRCWIVRGADNETPYAVRLFPKETCSCPSVKKCYHIIACKLMIGQDISDHTKPNMTLLTQRVRQKNKERPSGRKPPRKRDFDQVAANSKFIVFPIDVYIFLYFHITDVNDSEGESIQCPSNVHPMFRESFQFQEMTWDTVDPSSLRNHLGKLLPPFVPVPVPVPLLPHPSNIQCTV